MSTSTPVHDTQATAHTVTARRARRCDGFRCWVQIQPGEQYVRSVAFPRHEANGGTTPWVLCLCRGCHAETGQEMPPRRTRRTIKKAVAR